MKPKPSTSQQHVVIPTRNAQDYDIGKAFKEEFGHKNISLQMRH